MTENGTDPAIYPRVTEILRAMGLSKEFPDLPAVRWGRDRGRAVHKAIELYEWGQLDETTLHPDVRGPFTGYLAFKRETGYMPLAFEEPVVHAGLRYRGTLDSRGLYGGADAILDFKCSKQPDLDAASYQLGAYAMAFMDSDTGGNVMERTLPPRYVIQLGEDSYRAHDVTSEVAVRVFEAATVVYWAQREGLPSRRAKAVRA